MDKSDSVMDYEDEDTEQKEKKSSRPIDTVNMPISTPSSETLQQVASDGFVVGSSLTVEEPLGVNASSNPVTFRYKDDLIPEAPSDSGTTATDMVADATEFEAGMHTLTIEQGTAATENIVVKSESERSSDEPQDLKNLIEPSPVGFGVKDDERFLTPPPASTLLIRRARSSSTGAATYVVSSSTTSTPALPDDEFTTKSTPKNVRGGKGSFCGIRSSRNVAGKDKSVKRKPGRPLGSVGPYRKRFIPEVKGTDYGNGEVRVSSRMSTSIFKHDIPGTSGGMFGASQDSPWIYPTAIRNSQLSGGKPPMAGFRKPYSKAYKKEKDLLDNIDPLTGKRRYTRRKKLEDAFDDLSAESDNNEPEQPVKFHLSDNGIWRPTDDLRLIVNLQATNDLESIYYGVKFSCHFSYRDIEERWRQLLYNEKSGLVAQNAILGLHPDVKAKIYRESLFSPDEENLISIIKVAPDSNPDIKLFQTLLEENPNIFNKYRTSRSLLMHWLDMKDFHLLSNQNPLDYNPGQTFEDFEDCVCENDDDSDDDIESESILLELKTEERNLKKKLRLLDDEINAWQAITGQIIEDGMKNNTLPPLPTDFDGKTYALLRGKEVYYGMTSREIILGRSTKEYKVDADLTEEGSSMRISRKQAIIRLKRMGRFVIINKGKRPIFVDKKVVPYRCAAVLHDQSVIQISQISLVFFINEALIARAIERDVSGEIYASFKDLENESSSTSSVSKASDLPSTLAVPRHYSLYTSSSSSYGVVQTQYRNGSVVGPHGASGSSASAPINHTLLGDTDGTYVPICQPPASYVTI